MTKKPKNDDNLEDQELKQKVEETLEDAQETVVQADCKKCAEYMAGWKRAVADYENLKRQAEEDKIHFAKYAHESMLQELLPAIDQFETALAHLPDTSNLPEPEKKQIDSWIKGIKAVNTLWQQMFDEIGLEKIATDCEFDPNSHNAVSQESNPEYPDGTILKVIQNGYKLKDNVLRPTKVIVNSLNSES